MKKYKIKDELKLVFKGIVDDKLLNAKGSKQFWKITAFKFEALEEVKENK